METLEENNIKRTSGDPEVLLIHDFDKFFKEARDCGLNPQVSALYAITNI